MKTPLITPNELYPDLATVIGISSLYFKREDLHPLGSHKGRSIPHMIDTYMTAGTTHFVISSSGNAALAAGLYIQKLNAETAKTKPITLEILVGKKINPKKLAKIQALKDEHITVSIHDRPLQVLTVKIHEDPSIKSLRQSVDDTALTGYEELARELAEIPDLQAIFVGTSSGTTAQALAEYFIKNKQETYKNKKGTSSRPPVEIHMVQTPSCHPLSDAFQTEAEAATESDEKSIADAIVDQVAHRKLALIPLIEETGGAGWIANNESVRTAQELVKKHAGLAISSNSALSVAGLMNAVYTGRSWSGSVVCIITGE